MYQFDFDPYKTLKSLVEVTAPYTGNEFLKVVCEQLKILFDANRVFITEALNYNPTTKVKILYSTNEETIDRFELEGTPCKLIYDGNTVHIPKDVNIDFAQAKGTSFQSFYGIPILDKEKNCVGHIAILSNKKGKIPKEIEEIAVIFSRRVESEYERIGLEKENERIRKELYDLTIIDGLTNVYNRNFFSKKSAEVFHQVQRELLTATMIFLDIDNFKTINDTFGHTKGDFVLEEVGKILNKITREDIDFVCRTGGEEFGIICLNSNINHSIELANRIMKETREFFKEKDLLVTFSVGISLFDKTHGSWQSVYALADKKMHKAKENGKNQIQY